MIVYRVTNQLNGKMYIGKTTKTAAFRWTYHLNNAKRGVEFPLYRALRKYGVDAFKVEGLYEAKTFGELNAMETFFIVLHQSHLKENGYNLTMGGDGAVGYHQTKEHRQKIQASIRALGPAFGEKIRRAKLGKKLSKAHCLAIGNSKRGSKSPWFGKKRPEVIAAMQAARPEIVSVETRQKMRAAKLGKTNKTAGTFWMHKEGQKRRVSVSDGVAGTSQGWLLGQGVRRAICG